MNSSMIEFNKSASLDAHKQFTRNQQGGGGMSQAQPIAAAQSLKQADLDVDVELSAQPQMHLVPCRWNRSGWKYVEVDPKEHSFFNNPNRVNSFGIAAPQKQRKA